MQRKKNVFSLNSALHLKPSTSSLFCFSPTTSILYFEANKEIGLIDMTDIPCAITRSQNLCVRYCCQISHFININLASDIVPLANNLYASVLFFVLERLVVSQISKCMHNLYELLQSGF